MENLLIRELVKEIKKSKKKRTEQTNANNDLDEAWEKLKELFLVNQQVIVEELKVLMEEHNKGWTSQIPNQIAFASICLFIG